MSTAEIGISLLKWFRQDKFKSYLYCAKPRRRCLQLVAHDYYEKFLIIVKLTPAQEQDLLERHMNEWLILHPRNGSNARIENVICEEWVKADRKLARHFFHMNFLQNPPIRQMKVLIKLIQKIGCAWVQRKKFFRYRSRMGRFLPWENVLGPRLISWWCEKMFTLSDNRALNMMIF